MPVRTGPGSLLRWIAAAAAAALVLMGGLSIAIAEENPWINPGVSAPHGAVPGATGRPLDLVSLARRHEGQTARDLHLPRSLWCADFVNLVRREAGLRPVPSRLARDQAKGGHRLAEARVGAVVVFARGRGGTSGHVGVISGVRPNGDLVVISGNHNRRVAEAVYPRRRVVAIVDPS